MSESSKIIFNLFWNLNVLETNKIIDFRKGIIFKNHHYLINLHLLKWMCKFRLFIEVRTAAGNTSLVLPCVLIDKVSKQRTNLTEVCPN